MSLFSNFPKLVGTIQYEESLPTEDVKDYVFLKHYKVLRTEVKNENGKTLQVTYYSDEHKYEYSISEMVDGKVCGRVQLFERGIIQLSFFMKDGERYGLLKMYSNGFLKRIYTWDYFLLGHNLRAVQNIDDNYSILTIVDSKTKHVIYRGQYNKETLAREGRGIEYDSKTGVELFQGLFEDDKLVSITKEFDENQMIEYESSKNNLDLLDRHPLYIGGYKKVNPLTYSRFGQGSLLSASSGMVIEEQVWKCNENDQSNAQSITNMLNPAFRELSLRSVLSSSDRPFEQLRGEVQLSRVPLECTTLKLSTCAFKGSFVCFELMKEIMLSSVQCLQPLEITSLPCLERVQIEKSLNDCPSFSISDCPSLNWINISDACFQQTTSFSLENVPSLKDLSFPNKSFEKGNRFVVINCSGLRTITINKNCFLALRYFQLHHLANLQQLIIHPNSCDGDPVNVHTPQSFYYKNTIELNDLPELISIRTVFEFGNGFGQNGNKEQNVRHINRNGLYGNNNNNNQNATSFSFGSNNNNQNTEHCIFNKFGWIIAKNMPLLKTVLLCDKSFQYIYTVDIDEVSCLLKTIQEKSIYKPTMESK